MVALVKMLLNLASSHGKTYEELLSQICSRFVGRKVNFDQIEEQDRQ